MIISRKRFEEELAKARQEEQEKEWMRHRENQREERQYQLETRIAKLEDRLNNIDEMLKETAEDSLDFLLDAITGE